MMRLCIASVAVSAMAVLGSAATPSVTFHKDVQPILQNHCQECHRPGEVAPMSLLTYQLSAPLGKIDPSGSTDEEDAALVRRSALTGSSPMTGLSPRPISIPS